MAVNRYIIISSLLNKPLVDDEKRLKKDHHRSFNLKHIYRFHLLLYDLEILDYVRRRLP